MWPKNSHFKSRISILSKSQKVKDNSHLSINLKIPNSIKYSLWIIQSRKAQGQILRSKMENNLLNPMKWRENSQLLLWLRSKKTLWSNLSECRELSREILTLSQMKMIHKTTLLKRSFKGLCTVITMTNYNCWVNILRLLKVQVVYLNPNKNLPEVSQQLRIKLINLSDTKLLIPLKSNM